MCFKAHLVTVYHSLFHSHLLYGNLLWGNSAGAGRVFIWQKKALRIMFNIPNKISCRPFFIENEIMTLSNIFIYHNLIFVKQNISSFTSCNSIHSYSTRQSNDLYIPPARLSKFMKSYKYLQIKLFNKLPFSFRNTDNTNSFKSKLSKWLTSHAFYTVDEFFNHSDFSFLLNSNKQSAQ